jgi:hypothetical protein
MNCKGFGRERSWNNRVTITTVSRGTEENYEKPQEGRCTGRDFNRASAKYKSKALPPDHPIRLQSIFYIYTYIHTYTLMMSFAML